MYGDPSGKSADTRSEQGQNDFRIIMTELSNLRPNLRVHSKAPAVAMRGNWINSILGFEEGGIKLSIDENCGQTISDFSYLKEASDGTKHKEKVKDSETNVTYEKYGHFSDCADYMLTFAFNSEYDKFQRGGITNISFGKNRNSKNSY